MRNKLLLLAVLISVTIFVSCSQKEESAKEEAKNLNSFGLDVDSLIEVHGTIEKNQTLSDLLIPHELTSQKIHEIAERARDKFPVRQFKTGDEYYIYAKWDTIETVNYFVYVKDPIHYVVFDLRDSIKIYSGKKNVEIKENIASGTIESSLYETLQSQNVNTEIAMKLSEIYAWQIDFFRIQPKDSFVVYYEQTFVDGNPVGVGKIKAANFYHNKENFYAFRFEKDDEVNYFDEKGNSLRKAFLKAPLKFSRISSRYSSARYHPILHRVKSHLGTDYAAPYGTPIMSVGDGDVIAASYTGGNGNYVKIRHNRIYTTQYLHMSRFAKGIRSGVHVKQGEIIGYVGSTGLATGPHVCFRFWKNGKQVDPLREKIPASEPIAKKYKSDFEQVKDELMKKLDLNNYQNTQITSANKTGDSKS